jgi:alpha-N-arabinofuranosidase
VIENNHFGTHEFLDLCELLDCEPYIAGNVGSDSLEEMQAWVEYMTYDGHSTLADQRRLNGRQEPWRIKYFGVGNESWGCGGQMTAEYYVNIYRHYQTYVRNYSENKIYKFACGASDIDYGWTEVVMREASHFMDGLSLHYYIVPNNWEDKGSATEFDEQEWFTTLKKALAFDEIIGKHAKIMDQYDPEKRVGLIIDEWGVWHNIEPGTNPGFLYQQNTLRDALVAGVMLNILNQHCDRVHMANIAQTVNVLQALIIADEEKMILTPTYHVFDMYKVHQNSALLETRIESEMDYVLESDRLPQINFSASIDNSDIVHLSLCNLDPNSRAEVKVFFQGAEAIGQILGQTLAAIEMNKANTFSQPENLKPTAFHAFSVNGQALDIKLPPMSVTVMDIAVRSI